MAGAALDGGDWWRINFKILCGWSFDFIVSPLSIDSAKLMVLINLYP